MTAGTAAPSLQQKAPPLGTAVVIVIVAGAIIMSVAMGIRQSFGVFLSPVALERGISLSAFAFAIALHNLIWGLAQPFAGAVADRYGTTLVVIFGGVAYAAGLALTALSSDHVSIMIGTGVLIGIGLSCSSYGTVLAAVGKLIPAPRRTSAMGLTSAVGSIGGALVVPLAQAGIDVGGTRFALLALAGAMLIVTPLAFCFLAAERGRLAAQAVDERPVGLMDALREAATHRSYILLTLGFFTCGFQLAFLTTHLPNYVTTCHLPAAVGASALAVFGIFNAVGSWCCGYLGTRFRPQRVLAWIYIIRAIAIAALLVLPKTSVTILMFSAVMGFIGLGTVPLTSGLIARIFGVGNLGMLFGVCFLNHQLGAFFGAWMGAYVFDLTGSYDALWVVTGAAGIVAAILHLPISDRPSTSHALRPA